MPRHSIRFQSFPRTTPPPDFIVEVVSVFVGHQKRIATRHLKKGLTSNQVLHEVREDLVGIGFNVEKGRSRAGKIERPVFYGESGKPTLRYQIDAYQPDWRCGLEVEAGRGWMGNAIYRDIVQAMVMVQVDHLCLAVANAYRYKSAGRDIVSTDFDNTVAVADAIYGHDRVQIPYGLTVIGY